MWFLIRSAFWLSLVFAHLDWRDANSMVPDAGATAATLAAAASSRVVALCADAPRACLSAAGMLPAGEEKPATTVPAARHAQPRAAAAAKAGHA